jgi:capsular exopolysaccharide synthesis family protein
MYEEKEIDIRSYLRILDRRKSTVITFFAITFLITVLTTFTDKPRPMYSAAARAVIERNISYSLTGRYESYSGYDPEFLDTQTQIIKSQGVAAKVVEAIGAEQMYSVYFPEGRKQEPSMVDSVKDWTAGVYRSFKEIIGLEALLSGKQEPRSAEAAIKAGPPPSKADIMQSIVRQSISVTPIENTRVVSISYTCPNPVLAMKVANTVAQAYIDQLLDMSMEMSGYSIDWMKKKADEQRKKLEASEQALHEYKRKHNIVTIENRLAILPQRLAEFSEKLTRAEARRKELETIYNQIKGKSPKELEAISIIADDASVDSINEKILDSRQKISELSKKFGPKHPRMIAAQNELMELEQTKQRELEKAVKTVENEYLLAVAQEEQLREMLDQTKFETAQLNERSIQLDILKRQVENNKYLYDALIKRMEEKGLTEKNQPVNVWVIEKAKAPEMPLPHGRKKNLLLGLIFGVFGGVGLAFFLEFIDNTVKSPEDIEDRFELPVLGTIEQYRDKNSNVVDHVLKHESTSLSESFKNLRTSILLSAADTHPRILLITSMGAKEGKSTVASCLAVSMARNGLNVLLVDGDMRRPQINSYFRLDNINGLSSYLAGKATNGLIYRGVLPCLDIMTSGPVPPNPSELLSSAKLDFLLKKTRQKYDIVIVDAPPLGIADTMILSRKAEGVILLAKAGATRYEMIDKGIKKLNEVSANITGVVLNMHDAKKSGYYYNYSDYYYSSETNRS